MSDYNYLPDPHSMPLKALMAEIEKGLIKIPQFQRDFVWKKEASAKLLDSLLKGFPIGTFIFWKTKEELRSIRNIGGVELPKTPKGDFIQYVLDGQQRLTSLFAAVKGLEVERTDGIEDYSTFYIDLLAGKDDDIVVADMLDGEPEIRYITLHDLLDWDIETILKYPKPSQKKIQDHKDRLNSFQFSIITLRDAPIDVATEVFTRLNVGGKDLSMFEIMVAKTYDSDRDFDLGEKYDDLIEDLKKGQYGTIPSSVILQCISACVTRETKKKAILSIPKAKFIDAWDEVDAAIKSAVDYMRDTIGVPVSQLLPYPSMMVPFTYFFFKNGDKSPDAATSRLLVDFFWRAGLGERYTHSADTRLAQDIKKVETILKGKHPRYDWDVDTSVDYIKSNGDFKTGRAYIKTILCLLASKGPLRFNNGGKVNVNNDWLKRANSMNYHHFFPRGFMKGKEEDYWVNHIVNITLIDDKSNKGDIKAKAPSKYISEFEKRNSEIAKALKSHFIELETFGIRDDNYDVFFEKRCQRLSKALEAKIVRPAGSISGPRSSG